MTTRAKRSATSSGIEALVAGDRDVMKPLMQEALQEFLEAEMSEALGAASGERTGPGDSQRKAGAASAAGPRASVLDRIVRLELALREGVSPSGIFLLAYYGSWPVTAVDTEHFSYAMATIGCERTRYVYP